MKRSSFKSIQSPIFIATIAIIVERRNSFLHQERHRATMSLQSLTAIFKCNLVLELFIHSNAHVFCALNIAKG